MLASRRRSRSSVNIWPGYVDALSALLMLVIFTLLIFTLSQVFLSEILSNRDKELDSLNQRLAEISSLLGLEKEKNQELDQRIQSLSTEYSQSLKTQYDLMGQVDEFKQTIDADKEKIELQLRTLLSLREDISALREVKDQLENEVGSLSNRLSGSEGMVGILRDRKKSLEDRLATEQERTLLAQQEIKQKEVRISELFNRVALGEEALAHEQELSSSARAQVELLNRQIAALRDQLSIISNALKLAEEKGLSQETELANLGKRLNILLAERVNELEQYRSEFFGRLREVLAKDPNIRIVGDRFLFPAELLFASGSAELGENGKREIAKLAVTLKSVAEKIPADVNWILQIDGHTDRQPIQTERFPSNWELSTARAVSVVRYLAREGIHQQRLSAAGFGEFHPIDPGNTPEAFQHNRRIEIKLTDR